MLLKESIIGLYYKSFTIVIYNHNGSSLYYKTTILADLVLAMNIIYYRKVQTEAYHYNRKTFVVQITDWINLWVNAIKLFFFLENFGTK